MVSNGGRANLAGKRLENFVESILEENGYEFFSAKRFFVARTLEQPIYTRQCTTGKDIYGKKRRVDLILYHPKIYPECLVIQCKWQSSSGSVEQKYPFEVLSIQQDKYDTIVILDGDGYSKGAKQWLVNQAGKKRLKHVLSQGEFNKMANKGKF